jgi:hypothetical protein
MTEFWWHSFLISVAVSQTLLLLLKTNFNIEWRFVWLPSIITFIGLLFLFDNIFLKDLQWYYDGEIFPWIALFLINLQIILLVIKVCFGPDMSWYIVLSPSMIVIIFVIAMTALGNHMDKTNPYKNNNDF